MKLLIILLSLLSLNAFAEEKIVSYDSAYFKCSNFRSIDSKALIMLNGEAHNVAVVATISSELDHKISKLAKVCGYYDMTNASEQFSVTGFFTNEGTFAIKTLNNEE